MILNYHNYNTTSGALHNATTIVAEELLTKSDVREIILSQNNINQDDLTPLIVALQATSSSLVKLDLSSNPINFLAAKTLIDIITELSPELKLILSNNNFSDTEIEFLASLKNLVLQPDCAMTFEQIAEISTETGPWSDFLPQIASHDNEPLRALMIHENMPHIPYAPDPMSIPNLTICGTVAVRMDDDNISGDSASENPIPQPINEFAKKDHFVLSEEIHTLAANILKKSDKVIFAELDGNDSESIVAFARDVQLGSKVRVAAINISANYAGTRAPGQGNHWVTYVEYENDNIIHALVINSFVEAYYSEGISQIEGSMMACYTSLGREVKIQTIHLDWQPDGMPSCGIWNLYFIEKICDAMNIDTALENLFSILPQPNFMEPLSFIEDKRLEGAKILQSISDSIQHPIIGEAAQAMDDL